MSQEPALPTHEERLLAGFSHLAILLQSVGVFIALIIWLLQRERSRYGAFQALQATIYQGIMLIGTSFLTICWVVLAVVVSLPVGLLSSAGRGGGGGILGGLFLLIFLGSLLLFVAFLFVWIIYGIWAGIQAFQGKPFRYVILGDWVERWIRS